MCCSSHFCQLYANKTNLQNKDLHRRNVNGQARIHSGTCCSRADKRVEWKFCTVYRHFLIYQLVLLPLIERQYEWAISEEQKGPSASSWCLNPVWTSWSIQHVQKWSCALSRRCFPYCPVSNQPLLMPCCCLCGFLLASGPFMKTHPSSEFTQNNSNHNACLKINSLHFAHWTTLKKAALREEKS